MADPRVVWVPFADDPTVASVRLRSLRPAQYLRARGWDVRVAPDGSGVSGTDVLVLQKAYGVEHLALARSARARGVRIVLDLCDNHLFNPEGRADLAARAERLREMLSLADAVTVSTRALADAVAAEGRVVDDAVELPGRTLRAALRGAHKAAPRGPLRLLWFGNAGAPGLPFGMSDLAGRLPLLSETAHDLPLELTVCSNDEQLFGQLVAPAGVPARYVPWSRRRFPLWAALSDVAVLPVTVNPYTLPKTANRLATALLHDLPCVSDPLPSHEDFAEVVSLSDWPAALRRLAWSASCRRQEAARGAALARHIYEPARIAGQWEDVLRSV